MSGTNSTCVNTLTYLVLWTFLPQCTIFCFDHQFCLLMSLVPCLLCMLCQAWEQGAERLSDQQLLCCRDVRQRLSRGDFATEHGVNEFNWCHHRGGKWWGKQGMMPLPEELKDYKHFLTMVMCDLSAGWKGLGYGRAVKQFELSCTCCDCKSDFLAIPNSTKCSRCCH
jgi:hypothetical protein